MEHIVADAFKWGQTNYENTKTVSFLSCYAPPFPLNAF